MIDLPRDILCFYHNVLSSLQDLNLQTKRQTRSASLFYLCYVGSACLYRVSLTSECSYSKVNKDASQILKTV